MAYVPFQEVCVPPGQRQLNDVGRLAAQIKAIQKKCRHDFRRTEPFEMHECKVPGVHAAESVMDIFSVQCLHCNLREHKRFDQMCPRCLGPTQIGKIYPSREYFEQSRGMYYGAQLYHCRQCELVLVVEFYDR